MSRPLSIGVATSASSPRSGALHATKECSQYTGAAGSFCTITSSNLNQIKPGSKVVYASPILDTTVIFDSDLVIDGPGNNVAFGHVSINVLLPPGPEIIGYITFSGGTGVFTHFQTGPLAVPVLNPHRLHLGWTVQLHSAVRLRPFPPALEAYPMRRIHCLTLFALAFSAIALAGKRDLLDECG